MTGPVDPNATADMARLIALMNEDAKALMAYLRSADAKQILEGQGFTILPKK